ncbi:WW domain-binding protein 11 [Plecturocebus cupreus]
MMTKMTLKQKSNHKNIKQSDDSEAVLLTSFPFTPPFRWHIHCFFIAAGSPAVCSSFSDTSTSRVRTTTSWTSTCSTITASWATYRPSSWSTSQSSSIPEITWNARTPRAFTPTFTSRTTTRSTPWPSPRSTSRSASWSPSSETLPRVPPPAPPGISPPRRGMMHPPLVPPLGPVPLELFPPAPLLNPGVLSAPLNLIQRPKADDTRTATIEKKATATISAKPQITNPKAEITQFAPTALRVRREKKGATVAPQRK